MMNKIVILIVLCFLCLIIPTFAETELDKFIDEETAFNIVLKDAELSEKTILDKNFNVQYDIKFSDTNTFYHYVVDALNGEIRKSKKILLSSIDSLAYLQQASLSNRENYFMSIVLEDCGISQYEINDIYYEVDDDGLIYEIEFAYKNYMYDYSLEKVSGQILEREITQLSENHKMDKEEKIKIGHHNKEGYIGHDDAKRLALNKAGLREEQVSHIFCRFETDDNIEGYEVDWIFDDLEYEYWIDAYTGEILEYEIERID